MTKTEAIDTIRIGRHYDVSTRINGQDYYLACFAFKVTDKGPQGFTGTIWGEHPRAGESYTVSIEPGDLFEYGEYSNGPGLVVYGSAVTIKLQPLGRQS